jgi:predicted permease
LRLALLAYPQPLRARYGEELAEFPATPLVLVDVFFAGLRERLDNLVRDVRHATRSLLRTPGATAVAILALALGVGANVAVFSVVRPVLLEPLPFVREDRLFALSTLSKDRMIPGQLNRITFDAIYLDWRAEAVSFDAIEAWRGFSQTLEMDGEAELVGVGSATSGLLRIFGLQPVLGRGFDAADMVLDGPNVVLVAESFWRARMGARTNVLGERVILNEQAFEIVGVAPAELSRLVDEDFWQPLRQDANKIRAGGPQMFVEVIGRLRQGATVDQAKAELDAILEAHRTKPHALNREAYTEIDLLRDRLAGGAKGTLELLWGAVALVLLIAGSNVAGILFMRAIARHAETGVRLALGAGCRNLRRQALTEAIVLSIAGGAAGVLLAYAAVDALRAELADRFPRGDAVHLDVQVLLFALAVAVGTGLLLALAPAWAARRQSPLDAIRVATPMAGRSPAIGRFQSALIALQVGLAAVLLTGAGLFVHSLTRLTRVDIGAHSPDTATVWVALPRSLGPAARQAYFRELLGRARELPGVRSASVSGAVPMSGMSYGAAYRLPGETAPPRGSAEEREWNATRTTIVNPISEDYFETVGVRLLEGRTLQPGDELAQRVVLNRKLAQVAFGGASALGRTIAVGDLGFFEVVGVAEDYRQLTPRRPIDLEIYQHWESERLPYTASAVSARPAGGRVNLLPALRDAAKSLHPSAIVRNEWTQAGIVASKSAEDRFRAGLIGLFAVIAAVLAGSGIFATVSFTVSRRTREIAIRRALGATALSVCSGALRGAMFACGVGAIAGLVAAYWLRSLTDGMLYEVNTVDPSIYAAAAGALLVLAVAASLGPASRAARLDPAPNLRAE